MTPLQLILIIVALLILSGGYFGYGRSHWGWGHAGDIGWLIIVILVLFLLFGNHL
jgi:hypothetical protein